MSAGRRGFVEGVEEGWLNGWAFDPGANGPARIEILAVNGSPLEIVADRYRADVQRAGHGDGLCGFRVAWPGSAPVSCRWADSGADLPGSPWRPDRRAALVGNEGPLSGRLDPPVRGAGALTGAMIDHTDPLRRLQAFLRVDGELVTTGRACRHSDWASGSAGDGFHGFRLDWTGDRRRTSRVEIGEVEGGRILFRLDRRWRRDAGFN